MSNDRSRNAAEWYRSYIFQEEALQPRQSSTRASLPALLMTARSLESRGWQSRESLFLKQGRLLAEYEDDYGPECSVFSYFPTYQALTDRELRWYFSWRTKLRHGDVRKTSLSCAFLYIYELLNQIGVDDEMDGYWRLKEFYRVYGALDEGIKPYLRRWLVDYVIYYNLPASLLADSPAVRFDNALLTLDSAPERSDEEIMHALTLAAPNWLKRSKLYGARKEDMDAVISGVLRQIVLHHRARCKKTMVEQFFGALQWYSYVPFESAVFYRGAGEKREYALNEARHYLCEGYLWKLRRYANGDSPSKKLEDLIRTIDSIMRRETDFGSPIQPKVNTKWIVKLIEQEIHALQAKKAAQEAKIIHIDRSRLATIRSDAEVTRDKLIVDEEAMEEEEAPAPTPAAAEEAPCDAGTPLSDPEYRLLQCLLYEKSLSWVRNEGHLLSVLVDSINEKLYDTFADSVLLPDEPPELIEDYIDELKGMIHP